MFIFWLIHIDWFLQPQNSFGTDRRQSFCSRSVAFFHRSVFALWQFNLKMIQPLLFCIRLPAHFPHFGTYYLRFRLKAFVKHKWLFNFKCAAFTAILFSVVAEPALGSVAANDTGDTVQWEEQRDHGNDKLYLSGRGWLSVVWFNRRSLPLWRLFIYVCFVESEQLNKRYPYHRG